MKFSTKLLLLYLGFTIGITLPICTFLYYANTEITQKQITQNLRERAAHIMDKIDRMMFERVADISVLAENPFFLDNQRKPSEIAQFLLTYHHHYKVYISLSFFDQQRIRIADSTGLSLGLPAENSRWIEDVFDKGIISKGTDVRLSSNLQKVAIFFAAPIKSASGEIKGAVVARVALEAVYSILGELDKIVGDIRPNIDLVDKAGLVLYSNYRREVLTEQVFLPLNQLSEHFGRDIFYTIAPEQGFLDFVGNQWTLVVHYPMSEVFAKMTALRNQVLLIGGILLVIALLGIGFYARTVIEPVTVLQEAVSKIGQGNLAVTVPVTSQDEIGHLSIAFNRMLALLKENLDALQRSEERFDLAMRGANDGLWDWNIRTGKVYYSPRWKALFGYAEQEISDNFDEWKDRLHPDDQKKVLNNLFDYFQKTIPTHEATFRMQHKEGHYIWILSRGFAVWDTQGKTIRVVGTHVDMTAQKATEVTLQEAKETAETANRAKSVFLASMSHELRTPLNGILGYTQILSWDKTLTAEQQEGIEIIQQSGEYLLTLINDILDLSKIEADKLELYVTDFDFQDFLLGIIKLFQVRTRQKGIAFIYENFSPLPTSIHADDKRLRQILLNVLGNAVKFTEQGSVIFRVGVHNDKVRFYIEDTGPGIAQENQEIIFLPFHQIGDYKRKAEGTGLGLAITRKLVELMEGTIQVESTLGQGSIFQIDLVLPEVIFTHQFDKLERTTIVGIQGQSPRVLVVDDVRENRLVITNILRPLGFKIMEAVDGEDAIKKACQWHPHLILMDLMMPKLDGFEATRQLRHLAEFATIPIIVVSASVFEHHRQESIEAGCNAFVSKPVRSAVLLDTIQNHLSIEWIYEKSDTTETFLKGPSPKQAAILMDLAMMGDIKGILDKVSELESDSTLLPFVNRIRELAKGFKEEQICELVQRYL